MEKEPMEQEGPYDELLSLYAAVAVGAEPLRCWRNAALAVLLLSHLFEGWHYIEGWQVIAVAGKTVRVVEHGWVGTNDGTIIDPSTILLDIDAAAIEYVSGVQYSRDDLIGNADRMILPLVCNTTYGSDGLGHEGYRAAFARAQQTALQLAQRHEVPTSAIQVVTREHGTVGWTLVQDP